MIDVHHNLLYCYYSIDSFMSTCIYIMLFMLWYRYRNYLISLINVLIINNIFVTFVVVKIILLISKLLGLNCNKYLQKISV